MARWQDGEPQRGQRGDELGAGDPLPPRWRWTSGPSPTGGEKGIWASEAERGPTHNPMG